MFLPVLLKAVINELVGVRIGLLTNFKSRCALLGKSLVLML